MTMRMPSVQGLVVQKLELRALIRDDEEPCHPVEAYASIHRVVPTYVLIYMN